MAYEMTTKFICDRCGIHHFVQGAMEPEGWSQIQIKDRDFNKILSGDLCQECTQEMVHAASLS